MGENKVAGVHGVDNQSEFEETTKDTAGCGKIRMGKG